jgi:hypothetical protein
VRAVLLVALLGLGACSDPPPFQARFSVRGRWNGARLFACRVEPGDGPLAAAAFEAALREALEIWRATGLVEYAFVASEAEANVVFGWRRGIHDACTPFGVDPSVAHTGPVGPGTFVHFDAGRSWSAPGAEHSGALDLAQAALHELGHVLGLDHTPDEESVMYPEPSPARRRLGRSDLAGLQALYGGAERGPGDLEVLRADGTRALVLPAVAPRAWCAFTAFDADGDGDEELLVWRTDDDDAAGGALWQYHFGPGPVLERTVGPLYAVSAPQTELAFARAADGTRLVVLTSARGRVLRRFDGFGLVQELEGEPEFALPAPRASPGECAGDLDGDGRPERVRRSE